MSPRPIETRYTAQRYLDMMRHRLGKTPASRHQLIDTFNEAGRALFIAAAGGPYYHQWTWTSAESVTLNVEPDLDYVVLPADFGTLVGVQEETSVTSTLQLTDPETILRLRADSTISSFTIWMAFDVGDKILTEGEPPRKVAAIFPVQTTRRPLRLSYTRTWIDFTTDAAQLARVPNIPAEYDRILRLLAQAFATEIEDGTPPFDNGPYAAELDRLVNYDAARQVTKGQARHSVIRSAQGKRGGGQYPHTGIGRV